MTNLRSAEDEWNAIARAGAARRRRLMIPAVVGCALFVVTMFAVLLGLGAWSGERAMAHEKALAERGLVEVHVTARGGAVGTDERARDAGAGLFVVAIAAGLMVGAGGFFVSGGKLSAEHARGFSRMR